MKNTLHSTLLAGLLAAAFMPLAQAATINVSAIGTVGVVAATNGDGQCSLIGAIVNANADNTSGDSDCAAGSGPDTIVLPTGATFTLTAVNFSLGGAHGLPNFTSVITIEGNGSTITRSTAGGTPNFRFIRASTGSLTLNQLALSNGFEPMGGGAILAVSSSLTVNQSTLRGNSAGASGLGGAIWGINVSTITLSNSTLSGNTAVEGGGLYSAGSTTLNNVTITGNTASGAAGGWLNEGTATVRNSLISGNSSSSGEFAEVANLGNLTLSGGNLFGHSGLNSDQAFLDVNFTAGNLNATSNGNRPTTLANILSTTLANNGGPTPTHALVMSSPAINASGANASTTDQRGFGANGIRDIGAFEFDGVSPVAAPTVASLSPSSGTSTGGTSVVISGTNLTAATAVKFGTNNATGFTVNSATQITATSPAGTGTVDVTVTTAGGTSATGAGGQFTYVTSAPGACGTAQNIATVNAPSSNLCATGEASTVSSTGGQWAWLCNGTGGNTVTVSCAAPFAAQILSLTANPDSILVNGSSQLTASSTANLPPTLSTESSTCVLGPASGGTIVTANVTGTSDGTCTVQAARAISADGCTSCYTAASTKADITVSKANQTINGLTASPNPIFVGEFSGLSATASSGLTVSFSTSPSSVCSNNGSSVMGVGAGQCTVTANQPGNTAFNAAPPVTTSLTVNAVPVNGVCGSAKTTTPTPAMPSGASLCSAGAASLVTGSKGQWAWSCNGLDGGAPDSSCTAPYGTQTLSISAVPMSISVGQTSTVTASSNANLPVSLATTSPACTLSGSTATGTAEGACVVSASQAGTGDEGSTRYVAAENVSTTITVNPAGPPPSACDRFTTGANVIDLRSAPGGQTARGVNGRFNVIYGSTFADTLSGGNAGNCIDGGAGNDRLTAGAGDNHLFGGEGNDTLTPGSGSTAMDGGPGSDRCGRTSGRATATRTSSCELQ